MAMGGMGSDIAVDAADIVLVRDGIGEVPHAFLLSRRMMKAIRFNLTFSMALNFAAIVLAAVGGAQSRHRSACPQRGLRGRGASLRPAAALGEKERLTLPRKRPALASCYFFRNP